MKKNNFIEGTFIATFAIVFVKILGLLYVVPFYSIIGSKGGALYGYAYNIYCIFVAISSTGIPVAISKIISEYNTLGYLEAKVRAFNIGKKVISVISVLLFFVMFIFAPSVAKLILGELSGGNSIGDVAFVIRCISFAILVIPYLSITKGYLQGHKYIKPSSVSQVIEQIVRIAIILAGSYLSIKVFNLSVKIGVGVAVTGAFFGGLAAIMYLKNKIKSNKEELGLNVTKKDNISNREIVKKIVDYTIPYVIINVAVQVYSLIDMVLINRVMQYIGYDATTVEFITSAITTWAVKLNMIINSLAMGMTISLIPNIVSSFVKNDWKDVNNKINKAIEIIIIIAVPLTVGLSFLSTPVWTVFYGYSNIGSSILRFSIYTAFFSTMYLTVLSILQGLNKFKAVYFTTISGFLCNAILDAPLMLLFSKIGIPPYYGATVATIIGYTLSLLIGLLSIKKAHSLSYKPFVTTFFKVLIPTFVMIISLIIMNKIFVYDYTSKLLCLMYIVIETIIGGLIYLVITYKMKLFNEVFGTKLVHKVIKKITFGKVILKDN